jgi:quercetin dioxygenase-like cupin family protein
MTKTSTPTLPGSLVVDLPTPFVDDRGAIQTLVEGAITAVQVITSKKDTVRANHYHHDDTHYMYVVSGKMRYYYRPVGSSTDPEYVDVAAGQMVYTPALVEHAVHFLEDCAFLNITSGSREQTTYEDDITRIKLFSLEG